MNDEHCACVHERLTDGLHHYLDLPSKREANGEEIQLADEDAPSTEGPYIAVAIVTGDYCFMRPTRRALFDGPSEAGEIEPRSVALCPWCAGHWSGAPSVTWGPL